jgi:hypothetical protein
VSPQRAVKEAPEDAALALDSAEQRAELRRLRATVARARPERAEVLGAA